MKRIEFFYDVSSPWTFLAFTNIQPLAKEEGAEIVWRPFLVGGVFNRINPSVYQQRESPVPAKAAYMLKDLQDWARQAWLKIVFPPKVFPVNSVKALRGCLWAEGEGRQVPLATAFFQLYWGEDRDISQDDMLIARRTGWRAHAAGDQRSDHQGAAEIQYRRGDRPRRFRLAHHLH
jgi:2-hydroxychromene-2-carboxylate isomerase